MQVFANGKWRFHSFIEFYVIHLRNQEVQISGFLSIFIQNSGYIGAVHVQLQVAHKWKLCVI